jgi:hypothetical protein
LNIDIVLIGEMNACFLAIALQVERQNLLNQTNSKKIKSIQKSSFTLTELFSIIENLKIKKE